jgi:NADH-quinone oxidoreductase subunit L
VVTAPLVLLAIPSVVIGFLTIGPMLYGDFFKDSIFVNLEKHPALEEMAKEFHGPLAMALHGLTSPVFWLALAGVVLAWYMYMKNTALPAAIQRRVQPIYTLLDNKYYMDWINENVIARGARGSASACGRAATRPSSKASSSTAAPAAGRQVRRRGALGAVRLHLPLRLRDAVGIVVLMTYFVSWPMVQDWLKK